MKAGRGSISKLSTPTTSRSRMTPGSAHRSTPRARSRSPATSSRRRAPTAGTVLRDGLIKQARSNVTGAQQGAPAPDAIIFDIVDFEAAISNAQLIDSRVGRLDSEGANGGPAAANSQPLVNARFDLYDAWA